MEKHEKLHNFGFSISKYFWISNWISEMVYESPKALVTPWEVLYVIHAP